MPIFQSHRFRHPKSTAGRNMAWRLQTAATAPPCRFSSIPASKFHNPGLYSGSPMTRLALIFAFTSLFAFGKGTVPAAPAPAAAPAAAAANNAPTPTAVPDPAAVPTPTPEPLPAEPTLPDDGVRVAVLGYHDFSEKDKETAMRIRTSKFRIQMATLRQLGITVISLDDYLAWKRGDKELPEKSALITLDDGWKSVYTDAFPILKEFGYPFTLYLYKNYIDGGGKALTTAMIKEMLAHGASLGSHSISHPYPTTIKAQRNKGAHAFDGFLRKEMGESKRFIEAKFPVKVSSYAYPGGFTTEEMYPLAEEFGYTALFTVIPGKIKRATTDNHLPRYMILGNYDKIFEIATTYRESQDAPTAPGDAVAGLPQTTPFPVVPQAGAVVNSRLPVIAADLATLGDLDPATLTMKVSGFGEVPATFDPASKLLTWQATRRLRQPSCQVAVTWLDTTGAPPATPLRWSFQIDRQAAYLPEGE
jgi:peptidoglycan/xylan/chitin deacetylase (PgdA/CDA1 family)